MPSELTNQATRREWRDLGFFYDQDNSAKVWRFVGSSTGLQKFAALVSEYSANPKHDTLSEHAHYGPYMFLEIGTWSSPEITDHWIAGPLANLSSLALAIARAADEVQVGQRISLRAMFAPESPYDLIFERREDAFDPAEEDPLCW